MELQGQINPRPSPSGDPQPNRGPAVGCLRPFSQRSLHLCAACTPPHLHRRERERERRMRPEGDGRGGKRCPWTALCSTPRGDQRERGVCDRLPGRGALVAALTVRTQEEEPRRASRWRGTEGVREGGGGVLGLGFISSWASWAYNGLYFEV